MTHGQDDPFGFYGGYTQDSDNLADDSDRTMQNGDGDDEDDEEETASDE